MNIIVEITEEGDEFSEQVKLLVQALQEPAVANTSVAVSLKVNNDWMTKPRTGISSLNLSAKEREQIDTTEWLSLNQASEITGVSAHRLGRMLRDNTLTASKDQVLNFHGTVRYALSVFNTLSNREENLGKEKEILEPVAIMDTSEWIRLPEASQILGTKDSNTYRLLSKFSEKDRADTGGIKVRKLAVEALRKQRDLLDQVPYWSGMYTPEGFLTVMEAARRIGITGPRLRRYVLSGKIDGTTIGGNTSVSEQFVIDWEKQAWITAEKAASLRSVSKSTMKRRFIELSGIHKKRIGVHTYVRTSTIKRMKFTHALAGLNRNEDLTWNRKAT